MSEPEGVVAGGTGGLDGLMAAAQGALQDAQVSASVPTSQPTGGSDDGVGTTPTLGDNGDTNALVDMGMTSISKFGPALGLVGMVSEDTLGSKSKFTTSPTDIGKGQSKGVKSFMPTQTYAEKRAAMKPEGSYLQKRKSAKIARKKSGKKPSSKGASLGVMSAEKREATVMAINTTSMSVGAGSHFPKGVSVKVGISAPEANLRIQNIMAGIQKAQDKGPVVVSGATLLSNRAHTALKSGSDSVTKKVENAPKIQAPIPNAPSPKAPTAA